jgi:hypothetical protein
MNKRVKSALFFAAVILVVDFLQFFISSSRYLNVSILSLLQQWAYGSCFPLIFATLGGGFLSGFLWNENETHPLWKKLVLRVLITTMLIMIVKTFFIILFGTLGNTTVMIYFFLGLQDSFMLSCVFTLVFLVVPDDTETVPKPVHNPGVIDGEIK